MVSDSIDLFWICSWILNAASASALLVSSITFTNPLPRKRLEKPPIKTVQKPEDLKDNSSDD